MPPLAPLVFDQVLPALFAFAVLAWAWRKRETAPKSSEPARCAGAWAFGVALIAAQYSIFGELLAPWAPRVLVAKDWLPTAIVVCLVFTTAALAPRVRKALPGGGAGLALALFVLLALQLRIRNAETQLQLYTALGFMLALLVGVMLVWSLLELACERLRGPSPCLVLAVACLLFAATLFLSGNAGFARLAGTLSALLVAAAVIAWRRRVFTLSGGPVAMVALALASCWINAWVFGEMPPLAAVSSCASFVVPSYAGIGPLSQWPTTRRELARLVLTVLLGGTALLLAWREMDTSGY